MTNYGYSILAAFVDGVAVCHRRVIGDAVPKVRTISGVSSID